LLQANTRSVVEET